MEIGGYLSISSEYASKSRDELAAKHVFLNESAGMAKQEEVMNAFALVSRPRRREMSSLVWEKTR